MKCVWVLHSEDLNRIDRIVKAAVHWSSAAQLCDGVYFLSLKAAHVDDAIVELNMTSEDLDRVSLILPSNWAGHASEGFVAKMARWQKRGG